VRGKGPPPLVIDTDPGIDDAVALAVAIRAAPAAVAGIVTVFGNAALAAVTRNARTIVALAGGDVARVRAGTDGPLLGTFDGDTTRHGPEGAGYAPVAPAPAVTRDPSALLATLTEQPGGVTLVTLGPLTNLARALSADEALVRSRVRAHLAMAGTIPASPTVQAADFNLWADPDAGNTVLTAGLGTQLVPIDATRQVRVTATEIGRCAESRDPLVRWLGDALRFSLERAPGGVTDGIPVHDAVVLAAALDPAVLAFEAHRLKIGERHTDSRGKLVEDPAAHSVVIATDVDVQRVRRLLGQVLPLNSDFGGE
jgi:pyrimidine-specific ribonucleoside hydrolase